MNNEESRPPFMDDRLKLLSLAKVSDTFDDGNATGRLPHIHRQQAFEEVFESGLFHRSVHPPQFVDPRFGATLRSLPVIGLCICPAPS